MKLLAMMLKSILFVVSTSSVHSADRQRASPFVSDVLKESYKEQTGDLKNTAAKTLLYNNMKKQIRDENSKNRKSKKNTD